MAKRREVGMAPKEPELTFGVFLAAAIFLGASVVYFLPLWLPGRGLFGTDYLAATYIFYDFIRDQQLALRMPSWVPHVFGGLPLFANPGSAFHPVFILGSLVLPTAQILPFIFLTQFWFAGLGMFLLLRELGARSWIALLLGFSFQFTGITASWVYAGHDGRIMVATMAPLLFFFLARGIRTTSLPAFAGGAATLAFALLSFQIQNAYYLLIASALWALFLLYRFRQGRSWFDHTRPVVYGILMVVFAFGIAGVNFLPFLGFVPESPRGDPGGRGYEYSTSFSMPPEDLLAVAVPEQTGASIYEVEASTGRLTRPLFPEYVGPNPMKLHTEYLGALVLLLLLLAWGKGNRDPTVLFFGGLAVFMLTLALGGHTPLYRLYYEILPGLKRFRAPDLAYYVTAFSTVVIAGLTLERLARKRESALDRSNMRATILRAWGALIVFSIVGGLFAIFSEGIPSGEPARAAGWARFGFAALLLGGIVFLWVGRSVASRMALVLLAFVSIADLWVIGKRFQQTTPPTEALFVADDLARFVMNQPYPVRVWNFPAAPYRGQDNAYLMHFGIDLAGGEHAAPLQRWNEFVGAGEGLVPRTWANFLEFPAFMDAAAVRYLIARGELDEPWLAEVYRSNAGIVYENLNALPRAYLVPVAAVVGEGEALERMRSPAWDPRETAFLELPDGMDPPLAGPLEGSAEIVRYESDRVVVRVEASRSSVMVLADNMYPGWQAVIDGVEVPVFRANHTLRGVMVPAGLSEVTFVFQPDELRAGFAIYVLGWMILLGYGAVLLVERVRLARRGEHR